MHYFGRPHFVDGHKYTRNDVKSQSLKRRNLTFDIRHPI
jgi:hypothetical protein